ncbi:MAG: ABC transporter permease, partial [Planctomycetota bacterium]
MPQLRQTPGEVVARFQSLIALALMILVMSFLSDGFLTLDNGANVLSQISVNVCLSVGMTLVIISGGIDLSVGAVLALAGAVAAGLLKNGLAIGCLGMHIEFTLFGAVLGGLAVGASLGLFNGLMVTGLPLPRTVARRIGLPTLIRFGIPPFVATLATMSIARGLVRLWTSGDPISRLGDSFSVFGSGKWWGIPRPVWIDAGLIALFVLITLRTRFGRAVYAVGGNERAARLSGLRVDRIKLAVYSLAGLLAAVAGLIQASRIDSAQPNAGLGYELDSIAAVVIGGTSLSGGRGSILGTVIGCLIIGVLNNGLAVLG